MVSNDYTTTASFRITHICGAIQVCIGIITLCGWIFNIPLLASINSNYIPMAPNTATAFITIGSALIILGRWLIHPIIIWITRLISIFVILIGFLTLIQFFFRVNLGIDSLQIGKQGIVGMAPTGIMSPLTATNFFLAGTSLLLSLFNIKKYYKDIASGLAVIVIIIGTIVILGYLYRTPLFYGGEVVPMALTTAIAFVCLGVGLTLFIGKQYWPLCLLAGTSTHARLMRTFFPITIFVVLFEGWIYTYIFCKPKSNPALISSWIVILLMITVGFLIARIANIIGNTIDAAETKRKLAEEKLHKLSHALEQSPCSVIITNTKGNIEYVNSKFTQLTDYTLEEVLGQNPRILSSGETPPEQYTHLWSTITAGKEWRGELHNKKKNGELYWEYASISPIKNPNGAITDFVAVKEDITERKRLDSQLIYQANHDSLTNLFNRRRFYEEFEGKLALTKRYGMEGALLLLDIDNFKDINDTLGHPAGDEILIKLAALLRKRIRETDVIARLGGDEFAIVLFHTNASETESISNQIKESVQQHAMLGERQSVYITVSIGIALFPHHSDSLDTLLTYADLAMYHAKEEGRNRICIYATDQKTKFKLRHHWEIRIREALENDLFVLHLQPILDLQQKCIAGFEALLRMKGEDKDLIYPLEFLKFAEHSKFISEINQLVVQKALKIIDEIQRSYKRRLFIGINLSGKVFSDGVLLATIKKELDTHGVRPEDVVFEITENSIVSDMFEMIAFINRLKNLGCRFAIDDFGVGYSSFSCLRELQVDYLKIDGSFIKNLPCDKTNQHLVKALVEMAHGLGKQTIAEFVECEGTVQLLQKYGVDYAQGYHIGKPRDIAEIITPHL